ncbi:DUF1120 domain-containing protein [Enterobacter hormaechei]|uniref:DUF1120 domain-containing protein n=1 Tax=Enterobacter hormaechei TaxID=158836 RepID=UPI0011DD70A3|nr:DUF1120 domain-containing protein [Enterobacter hormaechei]TXU05214.1 DUF1120 domain-containing protein [Enterobacter hormaechei]
MNITFKKVISSAAICAALAMSNAHAANDVTLKVIGNIVPGSCVPTLPNGGVVDYGTMSSSVINPTGQTNKLVQLGSKSITLTVTCDSDTSVGISSTDNRHDSMVALSSTAYIENAWFDNTNASLSPNAYGLGKTTAGVNIGSYTIAFDPNTSTADGAAADVISTLDINAANYTWYKSTGGSFAPTNSELGQTRVMTVAAPGTLTPKPFRVMSMPLRVTTAVQDNTVLGTGDTITLDGNSTISLVYL